MVVNDTIYDAFGGYLRELGLSIGEIPQVDQLIIDVNRAKMMIVHETFHLNKIPAFQRVE